jgi:hypothetical protein
MTTQYVYLIIFFCIGYLIVTDASVAKGFYLLVQFLKIQYEKYKWIVIHHPKTPWARYSMHRRSIKLAKELMKELEENQNV